MTQKKLGTNRYAPWFILMVFLTLSIPFLLAEIYIRAYSPAGYITPKILQQRYVQYAPAVFARNALAQKEQTIRDHESTLAKINPQGYRGEPFAPDKPEGTFRIMIYGGSNTYDINAGLNQDWPRQVQDLLRRRGHSNVEVINAGIPGHASFDCLGRFFAEGHLFSPDVVVLYAGWNDFKTWNDNVSILRKIKPYQPDRDPLYAYLNPFDQFLCEHSQLYVRLRYRWILWKYHAGLEGQAPRQKADHIDPAGPRQFRLTIETFVDMARNIGAIPVLMTEAHLIMPSNASSEKEKIAYDFQPLTPEKILEATLLAESMVRETAAEKKAEWVDASAVMSGKLAFFEDHIHLSAAGSSKIAEIAAAALEHLLPQSLRGKNGGLAD